MRISDWSSDVCSSDPWRGRRMSGRTLATQEPRQSDGAAAGAAVGSRAREECQPARCTAQETGRLRRSVRAYSYRSEEHTSELQSLMRISYAVFCLKKKKKIRTKHTRTIRSRET